MTKTLQAFPTQQQPPEPQARLSQIHSILIGHSGHRIALGPPLTKDRLSFLQAVAPLPRLFVGQIPLDIHEQDLLPIFSPYGEVEKITLVRGGDNKSRGCAMVQFQRWSEAEDAMQAINGTTPLEGSKGRPLVVHFANPRRGGVIQNNEPAIAPRKLFVGQIAKNTTQEEILDLFSQYGEVEHINVLESKGIHVGCAFVQYTKWAACEAAITALHEQHVMNGCDHPLVVKFADAKRPDGIANQQHNKRMPMRMVGPNAVPTNHYVHGQYPHHPSMMPGSYMGHPEVSHAMGIPPGSPAYLNMASMPYGGLPGVPGLLQSQNRRGQQYGSIGRRGLSSNEGGSSDSLLESSDGSDGQPLAPMPGQMMTVGPDGMPTNVNGQLGNSAMTAAGLQAMAAASAMPMGYLSPDGRQLVPMMSMRPMHPPTGKLGRGVMDPGVYAHKLFLGQVPFEASEQDLWQLFAPFGDILELVVLRSNGISKGCAFLTYSTRQQAAAAISALNGRQSGQNKRLVVKYAEHKQPSPPQ